jgi:hypothetical protein
MADVTKKIVFEEESTIAEDASEPTASADEKSVQGAEATTTAASADAKCMYINVKPNKWAHFVSIY